MNKYIFVVGLLFPYLLCAQSITGKVTNDKNIPLFGANVYWLGTTIGVSTNDNGEFKISVKGISNKKLIASYVGHTPDTIVITDQSAIEISLKESKSLEEIVIKEQRDGIIISNLTPIKAEIITQTELRKAACCDLAGCFETQISVQPQTTNIITNSKELRILGLSGVYNQILIDGFPLIQGLSYTYGISGVPGALVDNIYIAKGANSVLQGYESLSGQINVTTKEPDKSDMLFLNAYVNSFSEKHLNANIAFKQKKWSNLAAFHTVQPANKIDRDRDSFMDLPQLTRYMFFNKWKYGSDKDWGWSSRIGLRFLNEQRIGGQVLYDPDNDKGSVNIYGQTVNFNQPEVWTKTTYRFNDNHRVDIFASSFYHGQKSFFGTVKYDAQQTSFYGNLQYELVYSQKHSLKTGVSYRYKHLNEDIVFTDTTLHRTYAGNYLQVENIPGLFAENSLIFFNDKLTWNVGLRSDHLNQFGIIVSPRSLVKYDLTKHTVIRASVGYGWRTVNLFSENIGLLVSSRDIIFAEQLKPERAANFGVNFTHKFARSNLSGYFSTDFYRSDFQNQIFPDYDSDPTKSVINNFTGTSRGNGFQAELSLKMWKVIEVKSGYNYLDVFSVKNGSKQDLPFNPKHKVLTTFNYRPLSNTFFIDLNVHWIGEQRLPDTKSNPVEFQRSGYSKAYTLVNAQFTLRIRKFEIYTGCENIFDFRQKQAIVSWQNPFGPYFDTSSVWGPTRGREIYAGIRFKLTSE